MTPVRKGDRIRLLAMPCDPDPIPPGATGTVQDVRPLRLGSRITTVISVAWDISRSLALVCPPDSFEVIEADLVDEWEGIEAFEQQARAEEERRVALGLQPIPGCVCHGSNTAFFTLGECPCQGIKDPRLNAPE